MIEWQTKVLATFTGATAQVKPVNGRNPLVVQAQKVRLPMPFDDLEYDDDDEEWEEDEEMELREPQSQDEQDNGVNPHPDAKMARRPKRRRRLPPMPKVPRRDEEMPWEPPFEVLEDGTVTGPRLGDPDDMDRLPPGFDPPKGTAEGIFRVFQPPVSR